MLLIKRSIMLFVVLATLLGGCSQAPASATMQAATTIISLTDGLGNAVELSAPATRIVSLGPSNTEILFAIGAQAQVIGCDQHSDFPAEAKPLATIADYPILNVESIVALQPDLVLATELFAAEQVQVMRELGLTVYWLPNPESLPDGLYENIRTVGVLTGKAANAEMLIDNLAERIAAVRQKLASAKETPLVYYELDASDPARPWTAGPGSDGFIDMLLRMAGGRNVASGLGSAWAQISSEEILRQDPDIILLGDAAYGVTVESIAGRPGWAQLKAVRNGAVHAFDDNLVSRPGPRLVDALEAFLILLHPELK
jgi:iron complex transport system substrate-binding protein